MNWPNLMQWMREIALEFRIWMARARLRGAIRIVVQSDARSGSPEHSLMRARCSELSRLMGLRTPEMNQRIFERFLLRLKVN